MRSSVKHAGIDPRHSTRAERGRGTGGATAPHILVVDEAPGMPEAIAAILSVDGYSVAVATSGQEALQSAARRRPDMALVSTTLSDLSAHEVHEQLQKRSASIPVVFMDREGTAGRASAVVRPAACLRHPFSPDELLAAAARVVSR